MGGDYYDRPVESVSSSSSPSSSSSAPSAPAQAFSAKSDELLSKNKAIHEDLKPLRQIASSVKNPICIAIDVTGSMGNWSKVLYDKLPMFFGQLMMQNYLQNPAISFCGFGDACTDLAPLQICDFAEGSGLDSWLSKLWLEGAGGGQTYESYELAAFYYTFCAKLDNPDRLPYFFITGDEGFYPILHRDMIRRFTPLGQQGETSPAAQIWNLLRTRFLSNVYFLHKPYGACADNPEKATPKEIAINKRVVDQWSEALGPEHLLELCEPKACVDAMLGVIAITSGTRTLATYIEDMKTRGQSEKRIKDITAALLPLSEWIKAHPITTKSGTVVQSGSSTSSSSSSPLSLLTAVITTTSPSTSTATTTPSPSPPTTTATTAPTPSPPTTTTTAPPPPTTTAPPPSSPATTMTAPPSSSAVTAPKTN